MTRRPLHLLAPAALVLTAALTLSACGSSATSSTPSGGAPSTSRTATAAGGGSDTAGVVVTGDVGKDPTVTVGTDAKNTTTLVTKDLVVGTGAEAKASSTVEVNYVGYGAISGKKFDSSFDRGQPIAFPLSGVIPGWQQGIPGMKVGGRRLLVIPGDLAYGAAPPNGSGIEPNETLVFVVDLLAVQG